MYPEVQLPSPNGFLGHTRGQVNCAMARSKALINAGVPVYFVWNRKSHISNGTAKSVGSHSVSNTRCHGISVDDCAKTENLYTPYEAVRGPGTVPGPRTASYGVYRVLCRSQSAIKMPSKVAAGTLIFFPCGIYIMPRRGRDAMGMRKLKIKKVLKNTFYRKSNGNPSISHRRCTETRSPP
jgi:hypothetical protein